MIVNMYDVEEIYKSLTDEEKEILYKFAFCFKLSAADVDLILEDYANKNGM